MSSVTEALDRIDRKMETLADKAKRISYTIPTEPDRKLASTQEFVSELKKSARIGHGIITR